MKRYRYAELDRSSGNFFTTDKALAKDINETLRPKYPRLAKLISEYGFYGVDDKVFGKNWDQVITWILETLLYRGWEPYAAVAWIIYLRLEVDE